jgi:Glycosyl transferase family 8
MIRVFIAANAAEWLPARVLEFSIRETTSLPVEVTQICSIVRKFPEPQSLGNRQRTPFSFQRFLVPEICKYQGRAIYVDSDMQVFKDISELWNWPLNGCDLQTVRQGNSGRRGQFSVMLLDCDRLNWNIDDIVADLDAGKFDYSGLMEKMCVATNIGSDVSPHWNALETYDPEHTHLLHYTDMHTQPWVSIANPLSGLWIACLRRALETGFISYLEIENEIRKGHVRPSLGVELTADADQSADSSQSFHCLDRYFVAPYRNITTKRARLLSMTPRSLVSAIRRSISRSLSSHLPL